MAVIEVRDLTKRYGGVLAVDRLGFTLAEGAVTGFLGPNGAGKSTTLRMLLGLTPPTAGTATIGGVPYRELRDPVRTVGALLEATGFHPGRSGRDHLRVLATAAGLPPARVDEMLDLVDLTGAGQRRAGGYSLGMRQRLGLAAALLGDPEVLILDEPANGLDPAGIRWMRDLLRDYANRGGTVLLSSHLLHEVEIIADDIVMIGNGRIVCQGSKSQLLQAAGTVVRAADMYALRRALDESGLDTSVTDDGALRTDADADRVGRAALDARVSLTELRAADGGLEDMFLQLTADTQRERTAA